MNTMIPPTECKVNGCKLRANSSHHFKPRPKSSLTEVRNIEGYVRIVHREKYSGGGTIKLCNHHHNAIHRAFSNHELRSMSREKQIDWLTKYKRIQKSIKNVND